MKEKINIKSTKKRDFSTKVVISDKDFLVETELIGRTKPIIVSRAYREGKIVKTYDQELPDVTDEKSVHECMLEHHQLSIEAMREEFYTPEAVPSHNAVLDTVGTIGEALDMNQHQKHLNSTDNIERKPSISIKRNSKQNTPEDVAKASKNPSANYSPKEAQEPPQTIPTFYSLNHVAEYIDDSPTIATPILSQLSNNSKDDIKKIPKAARKDTASTDSLKLASQTLNQLYMSSKNAIDKALQSAHKGKASEDISISSDQPQRLRDSASKYINKARNLLTRGEFANAMDLICEGIDNYPKDPYLLSLHGYLTAKVDKDFRKGIQNCKRAIDIVKRRIPSDPAFVYPNFYLNLGRAYIEAGDRRHAVDAFMRVLYVDENNSLVRTEMNKLGSRRTPLIAFLGRSNPLNKYAGIFINRFMRRAV